MVSGEVADLIQVGGGGSEFRPKCAKAGCKIRDDELDGNFSVVWSGSGRVWSGAEVRM